MKNSERRKKNEAYLEFAQAYLERTQIQSTVNLAETESTPEDTQMAVQNTGGYNVKTELLVENDHVLVGSSSVIGRRQSQQDSVTIPCDTQLLLEERPKFLCVLSDGMGGLRGGEQASACATQTLFDDYYRIMWRHCTHSYLDFFRTEAEKINTLVRGLKDENGAPLQAGATLIAAAVDGEELHFLNIGDSRIYLVRDGKMLQLTHDQNYLTRLMEKVRSGEITEQEALSHPKREALISYCGIRELSMVEINLQPLQLKSGDVIVLCSDGLYRLLSRQEMIDVLQETAEDMNLAAFKLTAAATDKNFRGQDNTSVILIKIK